MKSLTVNIAAWQCGGAAGDLEGNRAKLIQGCRKAQELALPIHCLVAPEMALSGYTPLDELKSSSYLAGLSLQLKKVIAASAKYTFSLIFSDCYVEGRKLFNAAYVIEQGQIKSIVKKQQLVDYDVFCESRYFTPEVKPDAVTNLAGWRCGILVCEDMWHDSAVANLALQRPDFALSVNASPYALSKHSTRIKAAQRASVSLNAPVLYVNKVGATDGVVFDGSSFVLDSQGKVVYQASLGEEELFIVNVKPREAQEEGLYSSGADPVRSSVKSPSQGRFAGTFPGLGQVEVAPARAAPDSSQGQLGAATSAQPGSTAFMASRSEPANKDKAITCSLGANPLSYKAEVCRELYAIMQLGLKTFIDDNNFNGVIVGLSGGIDSALAATIAADTIGSQQVLGVSLPSTHTSELSKDLAQQLATNLGIRLVEIPIANMVGSFADNEAIKQALGTHSLSSGNALENIQSRVRANVLMMLSNVLPGHIVLSNGNKSELATGYFTLYGDSCGAFNIIKDLYKTEVYHMARWRNEHRASKSLLGLNLIPEGTITRPATAELAPHQKDEEQLMPYALLDLILHGHIEEGAAYQELIKEFKESDVQRVLSLLKSSEYKRSQSPIGVKLKVRGFGSEWRFPITNKFRLP